MKRTVLMLLGILTSIVTVGANEFSIQYTLPPLELTYSDFSTIVLEANQLVEKYDTAFYKGTSSLEIENDHIRQTLQSVSDISQIKMVKARYIDYQFSNYYGSITRIQISFRDYERSINITGTNYIEIQTIADYLQKSFIEHRKYLGGIYFRMFLTIIVLFIGVFLVQGFELYRTSKNKIDVRTSSKSIKIVLGLFLIIVTILGMLDIIKLSKVFSGFIIYSTDTSFISKHADMFTFLGFILAIITLFTSGIFKRKKIKESDASTS